MRAVIRREPSLNGGTLGAWYVDGAWICWNLEDVIREPPVTARPITFDLERLAAWVTSWKVQDETAIPAGTYRLAYTRSNRFSTEQSKVLGRAIDVFTMELLNVPGFAGIRVHGGNIPANTHGCQLPGLTRGSAEVHDSRAAVAKLEALLVPAIAKGQVMLTIHNPEDAT